MFDVPAGWQPLPGLIIYTTTWCLVWLIKSEHSIQLLQHSITENSLISTHLEMPPPCHRARSQSLEFDPGEHEVDT